MTWHHTVQYGVARRGTRSALLYVEPAQVRTRNATRDRIGRQNGTTAIISLYGGERTCERENGGGDALRTVPG